MKKTLCLLACLTLLGAGIAASEEILKELDVRADSSSSELYIMFCSKPVTEGSPSGDAFVVVGSGDPSDASTATGAFGLYVNEKRKLLVGAVPTEKLSAHRDATEGPSQRTLIVLVDEIAYDRAKMAVDEYSAREKHLDRPLDVCLNITSSIVKSLGFKMPYRGGLGGANAQLYFQDIALLNRNR